MVYNVDFLEIKYAMVRKCLSKKQLANSIGISPSAIGKKLCGKSEFTVSECQKLCSTLEINPYSVFFKNHIPNTQQARGST